MVLHVFLCKVLPHVFKAVLHKLIFSIVNDSFQQGRCEKHPGNLIFSQEITQQWWIIYHIFRNHIQGYSYKVYVNVKSTVNKNIY